MAEMKKSVHLKTEKGKTPKGQVAVYMSKEHAKEEKKETSSGKMKPGMGKHGGKCK